MAFEEITNSIKGFTENTQDYVKVSSEYYKLSLFKNGMKALVGTADLALKIIFGIFSLLFISVGVAVYINFQIDSSFTGYFIVGAFYLIIVILVSLLARKPLEKMFLEKYSKAAFNEDINSTQNKEVIAQSEPVVAKTPHTSEQVTPLKTVSNESI